MNILKFINSFNILFPIHERNNPTYIHSQYPFSLMFDSAYSVFGMTSIKKQDLLNFAYSCLDENEAYFEIGTFHGKSLISNIK